MGSLILEDYPIQVLPKLAKAIGLNRAIVTQQLFWLLGKKSMGKEIRGEKWVFLTYDEWQEEYFPFWSKRTIQRTFDELESMLMVESIQPDGGQRRKYYRLNKGMIELMQKDKLAIPNPDDLDHDDKLASCQIVMTNVPNCHHEQAKLAPSLYRTETTAETTPLSRSPKAPADPRHKTFIRLFSQSFVSHFGRVYVLNGGKEGKLLKTFLNSTTKTAEELMEAAVCAWCHYEAVQPKFCYCKFALTISGFTSRFNEIQDEISKNQRTANANFDKYANGF